MGLMRFSPAIAALAVAACGLSAVAQTAPRNAATNIVGAQPQQAAPARTPPATAQIQLRDGVQATVNDEIITGYDIRQRMLLLIVLSGVQPTRETLAALEQEAITGLIDERLKNQELAKFPQLVITDAEVDEEVASMAAEAQLTSDVYLGYLNEAGIETRTIREYIRSTIAWRELVRNRFHSRALPTRTQVSQAMRQETESATRRRYHVAEIYLSASRRGGMQETVNGAHELIRQMMAGAPFPNVARQFSTAPSSARGGNAGWVVEGTVHPALQQAFDILDPGQLSNPIVVEDGVYIIYMIDKQSSAGVEMAQLRQVTLELPENASGETAAAAAARLTALRPELTCDNLLARVSTETGMIGSNAGESEVQNLFPAFQAFARSATVGAISEPIRSPVGLHLVALCGRRIATPQAPNIREVEGRLYRNNLVTMDRRYVRDLMNDALIDIRQ